MRRDARAAHLVEHVRSMRDGALVNGFLGARDYPFPMGIETLTDPADIINAKAKAEGWPIRCDSELVFDRPDLNALRDVWYSQATTSPMSNRMLFDNTALKQVFRRLTVIERIAGANGAWRYRIQYQGTYLAALMGSNVGRFIDEGIPPQLLPRWATVFDAVLDSSAPVRLVVEFALEKLAYAAAEGFVAPLSNGAGKVNLVLIGAYVRPRELDTEDAA